MKFNNFLLIAILTLVLFSANVFCQTQKSIIEIAKNQDTLKMELYRTTTPAPPKKVAFHSNRSLAPKPKVTALLKVPKIDITRDSLLRFETIEFETIVKVAGQPKLRPAKHLSKKLGATHNIMYLNEDNGLNSATVRTTYMDSKGMVWISTSKAGVTRYDGNYFAEFNKDQGFDANAITNIIEDSKGNLWFWGQSEDFNAIKYDGDTFTYFRIPSNYVAEMTEDKEGKIVFTTREGLIRYNGEGFTVGLKSLSLLNTIVDKDNIYWMNSGQNGLYRLDGTYLQHFTEEHGLPVGYFEFFSLDTSGQLWFFNDVTSHESTQYLCKMSADSISIFENFAFLGDKRILRVFSDSHNIIWISTSDGVVSYDGTYFTEITESEGLTFKKTSDMNEDNDGNIWIRSWISGINIIMRENFINYTGDPNLNNVGSISKDSAGNIWIGVGGMTKSGLYKYDGSDLYHYEISQGMAFRITEIMEDSKKQLWVGDWGKELYCFDGEEVRAYRIDESLGHTTVTSISEQANGDIWVGTLSKGIYRFDGAEFIHYNIRSYHNNEPSHLNNIVYSSFVDSKDNVWFGTDEGIALFTNGKFYDYSSIINTNEALVYSIYEDDEENVWFGTKGEGLFKYDGIKATHYDERNGLSDSEIRAITGDEFGGIWLGTSKGLDYINQNQNDEYLVDSAFLFKSFSRLDGLLGLAFHPASVANDQKGEIWWGNNEGLMTMTRHPFGKTLKPPELTLVNIEVANTFIDYRLPGGNSDEDSTVTQENIKNSIYSEVQFTGLPPHFNVPTNLTLPYELARIKFQFTGTDWDAPNVIRYQTQLIGLDQEWSTLTNINEIEYTSLSHGDYTFAARAIGKSGVWSKPLEYSFTILPPWWHSWWARTIYASLFLSLMILIVQWRTRYILKREKILKISEEKYRGAFDSIPDVFTRSDMEGKGLMISPSILDVMGYKVEEFIGKKFTDLFVNPSYRKFMEKELQKSKGVHNFEFDAYKKDGSIITLSSNTKIYYDDDGNPLGIESVFRDITQQKEKDVALKESKERFQSLSDASFEAIFISEKGVCIEQNALAEKMFGYSLAEAIGRPATDWIIPEDHEMVKNNMLSSYEKPYQVTALRKDGSTFPAEIQGRMMGLKGRNVRVTALNDISRRKMAEKALQESEVKFRTLVTNTEEIIFMIAKDGTFLLSEGKGLSKLGLKGGDVVGKSVFDLYKEFPEMLTKMRQALDGETVIVENQVEDNYFRSWYTPHLDQNGEIIGLLGLSINITEQKQSQLRILEYQKQLQELSSEITLSEEKLRKQIAIDLHDDVGQSLASSRIEISTLVDKTDEPELSTKLNSISRTLLGAIQATRNAIFNLSPPELNEIGLLAAISDWLKEQIEKKHNIITKISSDEDKYPLEDSTRILVYRSIKELAINTVKHAKANRLIVHLKNNKGNLEIKVEDNGIGFDYDNKITKSKRKGYGLFSVQERVLDMGGSMTIDSKQGEGTKIIIRIPLKEKEE